jgi:CRISPR/Cas system-associated endonuclease Cas1
MMTQIVLTPDQVKLYHQAREPVQVCDTQGKVLGTLPPDYSAEFIAELKRRAREPGRKRYSSEQVTRHMQALAEIWKREGPLSEKRTQEILEQIRAEDSQ